MRPSEKDVNKKGPCGPEHYAVLPSSRRTVERWMGMIGLRKRLDYPTLNNVLQDLETALATLGYEQGTVSTDF